MVAVTVPPAKMEATVHGRLTTKMVQSMTIGKCFSSASGGGVSEGFNNATGGGSRRGRSRENGQSCMVH